MNWNYKDWLLEKVNFIAQDLKINDITFEVVDEQEYAKIEYYSSETVYVVIKKFNASIIPSAKTQPIQIVVLSEDFSLENVTAIFNKLTTEYQYHITIILNEDNSYTYIKHDYENPAVMNNFIEVGAGRRSILYIPVSLFILENNISLIQEVIVQIDDEEPEEIKPLTLTTVYNMQGNTQQLPSEYLSKTVRSVATSALNITIQPLSTSNFIKHIFKIMFGQINGNSNFKFSFKDGRTITTKLSNVQYSDAPNGAPALQLGFMV